TGLRGKRRQLLQQLLAHRDRQPPRLCVVAKSFIDARHPSLASTLREDRLEQQKIGNKIVDPAFQRLGPHTRSTGLQVFYILLNRIPVLSSIDGPDQFLTDAKRQRIAPEIRKTVDIAGVFTTLRFRKIDDIRKRRVD